MKWSRTTERDENLRDARTGRGGGGGGGKVAGGVGGMGIIGLILYLLFGVGGGDIGVPTTGQLDAPASYGTSEETLDTEQEQFINYLLDDIQDFWVITFADSGIPYNEASLTLFDSPIQTGCGGAYAEIGPHYCSLDDGIYLELGFFQQLRQMGGEGDFAQAYVIAHEFAHHVQNELGISAWVREESARNPRIRNEMSVRLELQADCLAGVWGRTIADRGQLDIGDIDEALNAAAAVGDDRIQASTTGRVDPESWTHGSSEQRQGWFMQGYETGDTEMCDTFEGV